MSRADFFGGGGAAGPLFEEAAPARIPMSEDERRVARILERAKGRANAIPRKLIEAELGMDERRVKAAVEGLRKAHDWPIGALRMAGGGYFLVADEEDAIAAFSGYWSQAIEMIRQAKRFLPAGARAEMLGQLRLEIEDEG